MTVHTGAHLTIAGLETAEGTSPHPHPAWRRTPPQRGLRPTRGVLKEAQPDSAVLWSPTREATLRKPVWPRITNWSPSPSHKLLQGHKLSAGRNGGVIIRVIEYKGSSMSWIIRKKIKNARSPSPWILLALLSGFVQLRTGTSEMDHLQFCSSD